MDSTPHSWTRRLVVERAGERLDRCVEAGCPELSRSRSARLIKEGWVRLNGGSAKPSSLVRQGDVVDVVVPAPVPSEL